MYLLSQNKKTLIKFEKLEITKTFGTYFIYAHGIEASLYVEVGAYDNEEQVKQEFQHIMDALKQGEVIYEVR